MPILFVISPYFFLYMNDLYVKDVYLLMVKGIVSNGDPLEFNGDRLAASKV